MTVLNSGLQTLRITVLSLAAAMLADLAGGFLAKRKNRIYDGSSFLAALLFAALLPPELPSALVVLGAFTGVLLGKEIFGGLGSNIFHPSLTGFAILSVCFPDFFRSAPALTEAVPLAILAGGLWMIWQKWVDGIAVVVFLGVLGLFAPVFGFNSLTILFSGTTLLCAFFFIADPVTTPITKKGKRFFAAGSAVLALVIGRFSVCPAPLFFSVLCFNMLTPWIDEWQN